VTSKIDKLKSANKILIAALVIASFFLGYLTNKVATFEKNETAGPIPQAAAPKDFPDIGAQPSAGKIKSVTSSDHVRGNVNAKATLVVYSDLECPFCKSFHPTIQKLLETYRDKIRLVYRHFPLSFHANAQKEAEASECIAELGGNDAFWKYVDAIFERTTSNGTGFALEKLGSLAAELGVNQEQFQSCLDSGKYEQLVKDQIADGTAAGVSGTPSTFVIDSKGNSQILVGAQPIEAFKIEIDKTLEAK
jgi:protein-disulfide isomerase